MNSKAYIIIQFILSFFILIPLVSSAQTNKQLLVSERNTMQVFEQASPYVVNVHNLRVSVDPFINQHQTRRGIGSGIIWDNKGYIITNYHVIYGATRIAVTLNKGERVPAEVVGVSPRQDIAVLRITDPKALQLIHTLKPLAIANSSELKVGQKTIAIGNPYGLDRTLTTGVISALDRTIPGLAGVSLRNMIQTDASINPGNSGGPLLDSSGQLIGMNTVIFSRSGASAGIGFAVPSNTIKRIVAQLIKHGKITQSGIGVQILGTGISKQLGIRGVVIAKVLPESPAAKAGLQGTYRDGQGRIHVGDVIISVDGQRVKTYDELYNVMQNVKVGQTVTIKYLRKGHLYNTTIKTVALK